MNVRFVFKLSKWLLLLAPVVALGASVTGLQIENSRVVLSLNQTPSYKTFTLTKPNRLVIDIKHANWAIKPPTKITSSLFKTLRWSRDKNKLRLVLDLTQAAKFSSYHKRYGKTHKLVIYTKASVYKAKAVPSKPVVTLPTHQKLRNIMIVIDPGHGGKDPGATGERGTHEKTVVLAISKDLQQMLKAQPGFSADLTRNGDYFIPLRQRLSIARKDRGDMFVAVHADAYKNRDAHGASVYALSLRGATSEAARWLAQKENESELGSVLADKDQSLKSVLINLAQNASISTSLKIGKVIISQLNKIGTLHHKFVEQAAFVVLKEPDIPSLLVETGFISNAAEEKKLRNPAYQKKMARALMLGIVAYYKQHPPMGTYLYANKYS